MQSTTSDPVFDRLIRAHYNGTMSRSISLVVLVLLIAGAAYGANPAEAPPTRAEIERTMGLTSFGDVIRGQMDTTGFVVDAEQAEDVISTAVALEADAITTRDTTLGLSPDSGFLGGVCPHDDHLYASRAYVHLTERISAPRVILIGVFHAARLWDLENVLVFDSFKAWHGPWGPVTVDPLRGFLLSMLPNDSSVISNSMHSREHSLEAIVPFLQYRNHDVTIVPILVPYSSWDVLSNRAEQLSDALSTVMRFNGWELGRDVAIVISSDAVHYGPDFDHAPFGTSASGYQQAVDRDIGLVRQHLEGAAEPARLEALLYTLIDRKDVRSYKIPWCGRFSIPFGVELLRLTAAKTGMPVPQGHFLRYATSLSEPLLPVADETIEGGIGTTAPSNLPHWVGYATVGFTAGDRRPSVGY